MTRRPARLWDVVLALGMLMSFETQFRLGGTDLGPGEAMVLIWSLSVLAAQALRGRGVLSRAAWDIVRFWAILTLALSVGTVMLLAEQVPADWVLVAHDAVAYVLLVGLSVALTSLRDGASRLVSIQWLTVSVGVAMLLLQVANAYGWFEVPGVNPWYWATRMQGWSANPNQFALLCLLIGFLALTLFQVAGSLRARFTAVALSAVAFACGTQAATNAFALATVAGLATLGLAKLGRALVRDERRGRPAASALLLLLSAALFAACLGAPFARLDVDVGAIADAARGGKEEGEEDAAVRVHVWKQAIEKGRDSFGLGFGPGPHLELPPGFHFDDPMFQSIPKFEAHNTTLELFVQGGVLGVAAFAWIWALAILRCWKAGADAMVALLVAVFLYASFHVAFRHPMVWFCVSLALVNPWRPPGRALARPASGGPSRSGTPIGIVASAAPAAPSRRNFQGARG